MKFDVDRPKDLGLLLVVGGPGGSGSSTVAKLLCQHFSLKYVYAGSIMRGIAKEKGFTKIEDFLKTLDEKENVKIDEFVDRKMLRLSYTENVLIESKVFAAMAFKLQIPTTVSIWLEAKIEVRAKRKANSQKGKIIEEITKELTDRLEYDKNRYAKLYGIDYLGPKKYNDIVLDTSNMNEYQTLTLILKLIEDGGYIK
ncbi:(d)CMP kinase [Candidatus Dojkabacteria bacterium]|jgi:cytidylate kinase|nr:(d)CMP kinase [Candidatus Dojkabacteria bacterium]